MSTGAGASQNLKARRFLFVLLLIVIAAAVVYTILQNRPWTVPVEAQQRKNPFARFITTNALPATATPVKVTVTTLRCTTRRQQTSPMRNG
jgi:hypothetical protein